MTFLHSGHNSKINLSAKEMLEISQEISRNFTPCFSIPVPELAEKIRLSPSELLNIGDEIARDFAPKPSCNTPELMLLPVDPGHFYAYWNLGKNREIFMPEYDGKEQFTLRIYSQPDERKTDAETPSWFDVAIDGPNTHQQVDLPSPVDETAYSASIGQCGADDSFIEFAHSNTIYAHGGQPTWHQDFTYCQSKNTSGLGISKQA
jgi:hypothetical protein